MWLESDNCVRLPPSLLTRFTPQKVGKNLPRSGYVFRLTFPHGEGSEPGLS
jgi:hypothetical protein